MIESDTHDSSSKPVDADRADEATSPVDDAPHTDAEQARLMFKHTESLKFRTLLHKHNQAALGKRTTD